MHTILSLAGNALLLALLLAIAHLLVSLLNLTMRPASSFLLSLLLLASIVGVQLFAMWPSGSQDVSAMVYVPEFEPHEYGVDVLQEFEDDVEDEVVEFSIHRPHRTAELNSAQDDRNELFGPPEAVIVDVADKKVQPQAHVVYPTSPWPQSMLRPPNIGLPLAG